MDDYLQTKLFVCPCASATPLNKPQRSAETPLTHHPRWLHDRNGNGTRLAVFAVCVCVCTCT